MITQGLNTYGGIVTQGIDERFDLFIVEEDDYTTYTVYTGDWYVRENNASLLIGPMNFRDANQQARHLSLKEDGTGLAVLITFLGARKGDPITVPAQLFVDAIYAKGRKVLSGQAAAFASKKYNL